MMTSADRDALSGYIRQVANLLMLRDWCFLLSDDEPESSDAYASVEPTRHRNHAVIRVCEDFRTLRPATQRNAITHELLHCHRAASYEVARLVAPKLAKSQGAYDVFWEAFRQADERSTDTLTAAFEQFVPLPDWPPEPGRDGC